MPGHLCGVMYRTSFFHSKKCQWMGIEYRKKIFSGTLSSYNTYWPIVYTSVVAIPGKPTGVTLLEAVKDFMVLGWNEPASNGGADIRGYFVDYRTVKGSVVGKWHEMNHQALTTTTYKVSSVASTHLPNVWPNSFLWLEKWKQLTLMLALCEANICLSTLSLLNIKLFIIFIRLSLGWGPEGERLLPVPGARHEHGRCEQSLCAQCISGVQGMDHYCARYRKT